MRTLQIALLSLIALPIFAEGRGDRMLQGMDLSKEQRVQIKEIRQSQKQKMETLRAQVDAAQEDFQNAQKSNASESSVLAKFDKLSSLRAEMGRLRVETMLKIRELLTEEQQALASKRMGDRREMRQERKKERRERRQRKSAE